MIIDEKFEFTWEGIDENDPISGSGCLKIIDDDLLEGEFRIHLGDSSTFFARRVLINKEYLHQIYGQI